MSECCRPEASARAGHWVVWWAFPALVLALRVLVQAPGRVLAAVADLLHPFRHRQRNQAGWQRDQERQAHLPCWGQQRASPGPHREGCPAVAGTGSWALAGT